VSRDARRRDDRVRNDAAKQVRNRPALNLSSALDLLENLFVKMNTRTAQLPHGELPMSAQ
jgi:hypothetical protein